MVWQQTPFTIPLVTAAVSSTVVAAIAWRHRDYAGARPLAAVMSGAAWWSAANAVALANSELAVKLAAYKFMYIGIAVVPVGWLLFAIEYTGRSDLTRRQMAVLLVVPVLTVVLVWTNHVHNLFWMTVDTATRAGIVVIDSSFGLWFWVLTAYSYLLLAVGTALIIRMAVLTDHVYRSQAIALVVAVLIPWGANGLYLFGALTVWDPTNLGLVISGTILMAAVFRHRLLDIAPTAREVARDELIDSMTEALIVVDDRDRLVDLNHAAEALVGRPVRDVVGHPLDEVLPAVADVHESETELTLPSDDSERIYDVRVTPIERGYWAISGQLITLRDITDRKTRERQLERQRQRLQVVNRVLRHDIRNKVNVVQGHAESLLATEPENRHARQVVRKSKDIVNLSEKARQLEQISDGSPVERERIDIVEIIECEITDLQQTYTDAEFRVEQPDRVEVYATNSIDSGIGNVIENAIEHNDQPIPKIDVTVTADGEPDGDGTAEIEIADNGPGISDRERVVIETGTETALEHSSGMGLWLVYWIVSKSGGTIEFNENTPRGAVITIRLPLAPRESDAG